MPQIYKNARDDANRALAPLFVYGTALNRLAPPLYGFGSATNVLRVLAATPRAGAPRRDVAFCAALALWQAAQVAVLRLQDTRGPRWFVPARLLPPVYDWARDCRHVAPSDGAPLECSICMADVDVSGRAHMVTPCDHVFHDRCLQKWLRVKRECPVCRAPLPSPPRDPAPDRPAAAGPHVV